MSSFSTEKIVGILLSGGKSSRMGRAKYALPFGQETLLQRMVRQIRPLCDSLIVVANQSQSLEVPADVEVVYDPIPDSGPLLGIKTGLQVAEPLAEWAYVTGCDMPFVNAAFVQLLKAHRFPECGIVIPYVDGFPYPLSALYRTSLWRDATRLLDDGERRLTALLDICNTQTIDEADLKAIDDELLFLMNVNTPQAYASALQKAGLSG